MYSRELNKEGIILANQHEKLTDDIVEKLHKDFISRDSAQVISRAVQKNGIDAASEDPHHSIRDNRVFSYEIKTGKVSNQRHSGRCWSFATLNTLRHKFAQKYKCKDFELSQNYLFFWDRIERANRYLQIVIDTASRDLHDRLVDFYTSFALDDGGQWANAASIVEKYGVVPEYVMPDTFNTKDTTAVADVMSYLMKQDALILRKMVKDGANDDDLKNKRMAMMSEVYRVAAYAFGEPPKKFNLEYKDDDKKAHRVANLTPQTFYHQYFDMDFRDYVVVTNAPDHEYDKLYAMPEQDSVEGGIPIQFANVPFQYLEDAALAQLKAGETVWVGNDILQQMDRKRGLMDSKLFRRDELLDIPMTMSKKDRLKSRQAMVSHAMTLTGFDMADNNNTPIRWKIENSWGDKNGKDGYFVMTEDWFRDYTYEAVINKKYLPQKLLDIAAQKPVQLKAWDSLQ